MLELHAATAIILNDNNEVLLQKKDMTYKWFPGKWCLFGGKIEGDESPQQALIRELHEELGINFDKSIIVELFDYKFINRTKTDIRKGIISVFGINSTVETFDINLCEGAGFAFFAKQELKNINTPTYTIKILNKFFKSRATAIKK